MTRSARPHASASLARTRSPTREGSRARPCTRTRRLRGGGGGGGGAERMIVTGCGIHRSITPFSARVSRLRPMSRKRRPGFPVLPFCCHTPRCVAGPESKRPACAGPLPMELAGLEPATSWVETYTFFQVLPPNGAPVAPRLSSSRAPLTLRIKLPLPVKFPAGTSAHRPKTVEPVLDIVPKKTFEKPRARSPTTNRSYLSVESSRSLVASEPLSGQVDHPTSAVVKNNRRQQVTLSDDLPCPPGATTSTASEKATSNRVRRGCRCWRIRRGCMCWLRVDQLTEPGWRRSGESTLVLTGWVGYQRLKARSG